MVKRYAKRYGKDLLLACQKVMEKEYSRSYGCFKRTARKWAPLSGKKRKAPKSKPYQRAEYPGQKLQVDVKYVPQKCLVGSMRQCYQYTVTDECTRWTFRWMYDAHSPYSSKDFLERLVMKAPFPIRLVQTDNGTEFTNSLICVKSKHKTLFETTLEEMGILYRRIRIATPRHNGKKSFEMMAQPNPYITQCSHIIRAAKEGWRTEALAALDNVLITQWGENIIANNPLFERSRQILMHEDITRKERMQLITVIESMHSFNMMLW